MYGIGNPYSSRNWASFPRTNLFIELYIFIKITYNKGNRHFSNYIKNRITYSKGEKKMSTTIKAKSRLGEKRSELKKLRENRQVPGVIYGSEIQKKIQVDESELIQTLRYHGNELITVEADGKKHQVLIAEVQKEPINNQILHVDFRQVNMNTPVNVEIPILLTGESKGVKAGGVVQQQTQTVSIRCLPNEIPSSFEVDITDLDIGDQVKLNQIVDSTKYQVESDLDETVLSVLAPRMNPVDDQTADEENVKEEDGKKYVFVEETQ
jgi:large subunit ribosomal protein L25